VRLWGLSSEQRESVRYREIRLTNGCELHIMVHKGEGKGVI